MKYLTGTLLFFVALVLFVVTLPLTLVGLWAACVVAVEEQ